MKRQRCRHEEVRPAGWSQEEQLDAAIELVTKIATETPIRNDQEAAIARDAAKRVTVLMGFAPSQYRTRLETLLDQVNRRLSEVTV